MAKTSTIMRAIPCSIPLEKLKHRIYHKTFPAVPKAQWATSRATLESYISIITPLEIEKGKLSLSLYRAWRTRVASPPTRQKLRR